MLSISLKIQHLLRYCNDSTVSCYEAPGSVSGEISRSSAASRPADISRCLMNSTRRTLAWLPMSSGRKEHERPTNVSHFIYTTSKNKDTFSALTGIKIGRQMVHSRA